jgi:hypothetical protein
MSASKSLENLYRWLLSNGRDPRDNLIMPWNHTDTVVEMAWMDLLRASVTELEALLQISEHPIDRFIIERAILERRRIP